MQDSQSEAVLEEFARRFPDSVYAGFAKARPEELRRGKSGSSWWPWGGSPQAGPAKPRSSMPQRVPQRQPEANGAATAVVAPKMQPVIPPRTSLRRPARFGGDGRKPCIKPGSGASFKDCPDCPEMVIVPAGGFTMGSPPSSRIGKDGKSAPKVLNML